ncbi:TetR/AcrR family transcriptional regulator [Vagococcus zengguangii]|uniref:TetR/AcrR family transcriptional regulator n=1 Tax=Vagococcus zengguangii TaxID=2571750 RepID=A0A4D7CRV7_9ENTE|nr:TetR/AcrR family transcriptional regulator C-terminal domain-containing protein [Vagococcus zengguangii]QCI86925.1 TetR/AcrR family transcriptional regulator [Vagococcus zengguangii]TLG81033.1 TetR/AcrR family transcriptional regulator [Vagococcus zengguangii]
MKKKIDLRVLRTKKMIVESYVALCQVKDEDHITIQDITDRAMINRGTFYAHFKDKQELSEYILDIIVKGFVDILDTEPLLNGNTVKIKNLEELLTKIFQEIYENKHFFLSYTESNSAYLFRKQMMTLLEQRYTVIFNKLKITENDIEVPISFIIEYMTSIFLGVVHWWITSDSQFPPDHMARLVIKLVGNGHLTVMGVTIEQG